LVQLKISLFIDIPFNGTDMLNSDKERPKKFPILDLDVLTEKKTWWVVWEYIFSGKLRQPDDIDKS